LIEYELEFSDSIFILVLKLLYLKINLKFDIVIKFLC
jgi:hypothetical protein